MLDTWGIVWLGAVGSERLELHMRPMHLWLSCTVFGPKFYDPETYGPLVLICHVSVACNLHVHDGDNSFTLRTEASGLLLITWPSHRVREYTRCDTFFSLFQKCPEKIFNLDGLRWSVYGYYSHHEQWDWQIKGAILSRRTK